MISLGILLFSLTTVEALQRAQLVRQSDFSRRATYNGGWALGLAGSTCPSDAPVACNTNAGSINPTCCPSGQTCSGNIHPYCCPNSADCVNVVTNVPVCANATWNMYAQGGGFYFCCEPGQFGVLPLHGYAGICEPLDQAVASSLIATPASQVGGAAPVTSQVVGATGSRSTVVVTSTLKNGDTTTITTVVSSDTVPPTATATATRSGEGSLPVPSGGASATITLTRGAEIGIAVGAAVVLLGAALGLWFCLRQRKRKRIAASNAGGGGDAGGGNANLGNQGPGPAPMYSALPTPPQGGQGFNGHQGYMGSPANEYKTPLVGGVYGGGGGGGEQGVVSPGSPAPPSMTMTAQGGQQYGFVQGGGNNSHHGPGGMEGRYEVPGVPVAAPVEAPNSWERGVRM